MTTTMAFSAPPAFDTSIPSTSLYPLLRLPTFDEYLPASVSNLHDTIDEKKELEVLRNQLKAERDSIRIQKLYEPRHNALKKIVMDAVLIVSREPNRVLLHSFFDKLMNEHQVLYVINGGRRRGNEWIGDLPYIIITTKGVYRTHIKLGYHGTPCYLAPLYNFTQLLTEKDLERFDQLLSGDANGDESQAIRSMFFNASGRSCEFKDDIVVGRGSRMFESVVRLVPGNYSNGPWQQLDGFFGMYFNPETNKLSVHAPEMV